MESTEQVAKPFAELADVTDKLDASMVERERERQEIVQSIPVYWSDELGCYVTIPAD